MKLVPIVSVLLLAAVFLYAGVDKALHYGGFVNALSSYAVVPAGLAHLLAPVVIVVELWIGLGLLLRAWRPRAALVGAVVLGLFTVALAVNQIYAPGTVCGCWFTFTLAESTAAHVAQNLVLLGLALTVWRQGRGPDDVAVAELEASTLSA